MKRSGIHHILGLGVVTALLAGWPLLAQTQVSGGGTGQTTFTQGFILFGAGTNPLLSDSNLFWDNTNKRLGIGTAAPAEALHVAGNILLNNGTQLRMQRNTGSAVVQVLGIDPGSDLLRLRVPNSIGAAALTITNSGSTDIVTILGSGNVGIGTTAPAMKLDVSGDASVSADKAPVFRLNSTNTNLTGAVPLGKIEWYTNDSSLYGGTGAGASIQASTEHDLTQSQGATDLIFATRSDANPIAEVMRITGAGNVGIGTTTPVNKLHVAGSITVDGNINAKYQDVAEWVPSSGVVPAGTVVVIDDKRSNAILPSSAAYDTRIAGVVTDKPGLLLGEAGEDKAKVATTGRVKVRATAANGAIRMGDLLVTSSLPGLAMKSVPARLGGFEMHRPGTLIGKALEPLSEGEGEILVLLSLQ